MNDAPIISIPLSDKEVKTQIFFSINCCMKLFECYEQGGDYRSAFAKAIFHMYQQTNSDNSIDFTEKDFVNATDESLNLILTTILEQDDKLKAEYYNEHADDVYERFYRANKAVLRSATAGISKSFEKMSIIFEAQNKALLSSLGNAISNIVMPPDYLSGITSAIANLPTYDFPQFQSALTKYHKTEYRY